MLILRVERFVLSNMLAGLVGDEPEVVPAVRSCFGRGRSDLSRPLRFADSLHIPTQLKKTPLYDFHVSEGASMVPFASFAMPLSYASDGGQISSHNHVRSSCGLFDVSHMVQSLFTSQSPASSLGFLESLCPSSLGQLEDWTGTLSVLLNETGGIIDDTIMTKHENGEWYVVTNAGRRDADLELFRTKLAAWNEGKEEKEVVKWELLDGWGLVALQGVPCSHPVPIIFRNDL